MTGTLDDVRVDLVRALLDRLQTVDWDHVSWSDEGPAAMADRMYASLPTVFITEPAVGACYTTRGLVVWRGATRQSIYQECRSGRLLGFLHGKGVVYPALQFRGTGRLCPEMRALLATLSTPLQNAEQVVAWLNTTDQASAQSPVGCSVQRQGVNQIRMESPSSRK